MLLRRIEIPTLKVDPGEHRERRDFDELRPVERVLERGCGSLGGSTPPGSPAERPGGDGPARTVALGPPGAAGEGQRLADVVPGQRRPCENAGPLPWAAPPVRNRRPTLRGPAD